MAETLFRPFKGKSIRLTKLIDQCCALPAEDTEDSLIVLDVFTIVSLAPNVEDGARAFELKANGDICTNERDNSTFQDFDIALTLCQVSAATVSLLTGWPAVTDADDNLVGFDVMEGSNDQRSSMEIFSGVAGVDCGQGARYGYTALPCTYDWQISDNMEFAGIDTLFNLQLTGHTSGNHDWGTGPYAVQNGMGGTPGPLLDPMQQGSHARLMVTDVPPPAVTDGWVAASAANGYVFGPDSI